MHSYLYGLVHVAVAVAWAQPEAACLQASAESGSMHHIAAR